MKLNICHLYPDLLNVYGDVGNILILKHRAEARGIEVTVTNVSVGDDFKSEDFDIVFFGGGQDYEQSIVSDDILNKKRSGLVDYIEGGKVLLSICGGYQLLGKYYTTPEGTKLPGLDILNIRTEAGSVRFIGNTVITNEDFNETYVGFENHSGRTYLGEGVKPFGKVIVGFGNNGEDGYEGCIYKNTYGSYFHGSLLSKNPELADRFLNISLERKYGEVSLCSLDDSLELKAKNFIINRETKQ